MLKWIVWNRTDYLYKMDLALNNLPSVIWLKPKQKKTKQFLFNNSHLFLYSFIALINL